MWLSFWIRELEITLVRSLLQRRNISYIEEYTGATLRCFNTEYGMKIEIENTKISVIKEAENLLQKLVENVRGHFYNQTSYIVH